VYRRRRERAANPSSASAAYARGAAIERRSLLLHDAYMRRMLKFGLPKLAYFPARRLTQLDPTNGMAWGVVGYMDGKRGDWGKALCATVRALEKLPDNPSVLHNAGQLMAWYDHVLDLPDLPDRIKRAMDNNRDEWARRGAFAKAYRRVTEAFLEQVKLDKDLTGKVEQAESKYLRAYRAALDADGELRDIQREIESREARLDSLRYQYAFYYSYPYYYYPYPYVVYPPYFTSTGLMTIQYPVITYPHITYFGGYGGGGMRVFASRWNRLLYGGYYPIRGGYYPGGYYPYAYREDIERQVYEQEAAINSLRRRGRALAAQGETLLKALRFSQVRLDKLRLEQSIALGRLHKRFRWDPPAVGGVVTPEVDRFPVAAPKLVALPSDPETEATRQLKLARLYVTNGMSAKAAVILRACVEKYAKTDAAKQAKLLLARIEPAPE